MKRKLILAAVVGLLSGSGAAHACSDTTCAPSWKLSAPGPDCANRALLTPGNDTRVNLLFLLRGKAGLGMTGQSYPALEYASQGYGRTFLDWGLLNTGLFPRKADAEEAGSPDFAGSRCISLNSGTPAFLAALQTAKGLPPAEREALGAARQRLATVCGGPGDTALPGWPGGIASAPGKAFLAYLQAADAFYGERWDEARGGFAALRGAPEPWVAEAAAYMAGRVDLNAAQASAFDEYGWYEGLNKLDQQAVTRAKGALAAYLKAFPQGRYAASATGLQRRALWLEGDTGGLAREYARLLGAVRADSEQASELVQEIDNKLLFAGDRKPAASGPLLLATLDLMRMRASAHAGEDEDEEPVAGQPVLALSELEAQAPLFAGEPELYGYLQATHAFYVQNDPRKVLGLIPDDSHRADYSPVAFSRQVLRGMALAAVGDRNEAGFWRDLLGGAKALWQRPTIELGLALNYERSGKLEAVFAKDSPITDSMIRRILLTHAAGPALLRAAASDAARPQLDRDTALFTLLYKQLTRGDYAGFAASRALVGAGGAIDTGLWSFLDQDSVPVGLFARGRWSDGYPCQPIAATAQALARHPQDSAARLCLGDFLRLNGFDGFTALDDAPPKDELGGAAREFPGQPVQRGAIYAAIIANPRAPAGDRAYALYRAVRCYAPSGNNSCGGADVDSAQRKAWYDQLKTQYPASPWARKLRFYW